mmetsp:Transcript_28835/g.46300  ORF Transcript_28835/g.46300 Transcript_28835/m.46300 type:complete len:276 (+) Transcript_28835:176-1003(+)
MPCTEVKSTNERLLRLQSFAPSLFVCNLQHLKVPLEVSPDTDWLVLGPLARSTDARNLLFVSLDGVQGQDIHAEVRDGKSWLVARDVCDPVNTANEAVVAPASQLICNVDCEGTWDHRHRPPLSHPLLRLHADLETWGGGQQDGEWAPIAVCTQMDILSGRLLTGRVPPRFHEAPVRLDLLLEVAWVKGLPRGSCQREREDLQHHLFEPLHLRVVGIDAWSEMWDEVGVGVGAIGTTILVICRPETERLSEVTRPVTIKECIDAFSLVVNVAAVG